MASASTSRANQKHLPRGVSKKILKKGSNRDPALDSLDLTGLSSLVAKPAVRRKIYSEARSFLGDARSETQELSSKALFQQAAASVRQSVRKASIAGLAIDQMSQSQSGVDFRSQAADELAGSAAVCRLSATSTSSKEQMPETTLQGGMDADHVENEAEVETERLRQHFLRTLEEVKQILERIDLSDTLEEVSHVLDWVKELEAMMDEMTSSSSSSLENYEVVAEARKDVEERVQHALEMASKKIPEAVQAIHRSRSPNTSELATNALMNMEGFKEQSELLGAPFVKPKKAKVKGHKKQDQEQATERRFSREQLRQKLRSNALHGWMPLPPPLRTETPQTRDERSESWLKWWSHEEGDGLDRREAFFQNLPPNKLTLMEMELRDAIIDFLEQRKSEDSPTWDEIRVQPMVVECTKKALPHFVSLEEWLHRRQRLSNHGIITWPPPPPLWRLEPTERWKKDLPPEPSPEAHTKFQRRDSTQRRGSSVFGVNFQVTDHGQIFGVLAGDEEAVCELPWPCSSVVPEQKNFGWIKSSGARGCLPSVATHGNMTVEDVMAWRLSHRFRQLRVEPVLQSMWQALAKQRLPKTCKCEHCRGTLQYEITLASSE